jgi:phosphohistidine swiveling domain-containing protein
MIDWNYSLWTPWAQPCAPLYLSLTLNPSFEPLRQKIGSTLFTSIIHFENGTGTWTFRNDEAEALGNRMLDYLQVPAHRNDFEDELAASAADLEEMIVTIRGGQDQETASLDDAISRFEGLEAAYYRFYVLGAFVEPVQIAAQQRLTGALISAAKAAGASSDDKAKEMASLAYSSDQETFATGITRSLRDLAAAIAEAGNEYAAVADVLHAPPAEDDAAGQTGAGPQAARIVNALQDQVPHVGEQIAAHAIKYSWSLNNYARCLEMSPVDVIKEMMSHGDSPAKAAIVLSDELQAIRDNLNVAQDVKRSLSAHLSAFDLSVLALHELIGVRLLDLRKKLVMQTNGAFTLILSQLSRLLRVPLSNLLYLLPEEIPSYCRSPQRYEDRIVLRKETLIIYRADLSVLDEQAYRWSDGFSPMEGSYLAEGKLAGDRLLERLDQRLNLLQHETSIEREITGTTIYYDPNTPVLRGRVVVIRDPATDTLEKGDVLVASSTTPDFIGAIRRCSAIVTDWGGQTSHAAITARELGKPCIIGTDFASMVLRTGDNVEIDFPLGVVRQV